MSTDHWFDRLNKNLLDSASRRVTRRAAAALAARLVLGGAPATAAKPRRKPKRCAKALCARHFASRRQRRACEKKCGRCRVRAKFCIAGPDLAHPDLKHRHATCCHESQKCCQETFTCCRDSAKCCPAAHVAAGKAPCCAGECCLEAPTGCCPKHHRCCAGVGCVAGDRCPEEACADGRPRCNGQCCPAGLECVDGRCQCAPICNDWRGRRCCPPGERCFGTGQNQACCLTDYIDPPCPFHQDGALCYPDVPFVCCDGHAHSRNPPEDYWCFGRVPTGGVFPIAQCTHPDCYPPIGIYRPS